jgi:hypothetical protein
VSLEFLPGRVPRIALEKGMKQHPHVVDVEVADVQGLWEERRIGGVEGLELSDEVLLED